MSRSKRHGKKSGKGDMHQSWDDDRAAPVWGKDPGGNVVSYSKGGSVETVNGYVIPQLPHQGGGKEYKYVKCGHTGREIVYRQRETGVTLFGAAQFDLDLAGLNVVVDCAGLGTKFMTPAVNHLPKEFEALRAHAELPLLVQIDWPDRRVPLLKPTFWRTIWELCQPGWQVAFCCVGGHGRTGTSLASMLVADGWTAKQAMAHVREWHCSKAVETSGQEEYVKRVQLELWGEDVDCPLQKEDSVAWVLESGDVMEIDDVMVVGN